MPRSNSETKRLKETLSTLPIAQIITLIVNGRLDVMKYSLIAGFKNPSDLKKIKRPIKKAVRDEMLKLGQSYRYKQTKDEGLYRDLMSFFDRLIDKYVAADELGSYQYLFACVEDFRRRSLMVSFRDFGPLQELGQIGYSLGGQTWDLTRSFNDRLERYLMSELEWTAQESHAIVQDDVTRLGHAGDLRAIISLLLGMMSLFLLSDNLGLCLILGLIAGVIFFILLTALKHRVAHSYFRIDYMVEAFGVALEGAIMDDVEQFRTAQLAPPPEPPIPVPVATPRAGNKRNAGATAMPPLHMLETAAATAAPVTSARRGPRSMPASSGGFRFGTIVPFSLNIIWNFNGQEINYTYGELEPTVFVMYNIEPEYGHFIWWDETEIRSNSRGIHHLDDLLPIFKTLAVSGRVRPSEGEAGIVKCHNGDTVNGAYKLKTFREQFAANQHRVFCTRVATVNVGGVDRNLYQAYKMLKTH
jgi:hypothetical protein